MALLPFLMNGIMDDFVNPPPSLFDQNFGLGLYPSIEHNPRVHGPWRSGYLRPWRHVPYGESGISNVTNSKDEFKVNLDVQQFKPDEINVKLQNDFLVVEGKHEERQDNHGFISRQFQRRYKLPDNVDADKIKSNLSTDGVLTLYAPKKILEVAGERTIPIEATNKPALKKPPQPHSNSNQERMES